MVKIRRGTVDDAQAIAHVQVATWRTTYAGIVPDDHLAGLDPVRMSEKWGKVLAEAESETCFFVTENAHGDVVGFACGGPLREPLAGYEGELYAIYILQDEQRRGMGRALARAVVCDLVDRGMTSMVIWALAENPCRGFYDALGGRVLARRDVEMGGARLPEVAYVWPDLPALVGQGER
jgi:ribosomal protein S18 acetylase RimI-like enzyme